MARKYAAIWTFTNPFTAGYTASNRIAKFISKEVFGDEGRIFYDKHADNLRRIDTLIIVNGAYAFCGYLDVLARAVLRAKKVVWVQNDYTIVPPKKTSKGESPFRAAFRERAERGFPDMEYWSTCEESFSLVRGTYVNWNALTWDPLPWKKKRPPHGNDRTVLYYGAYRNNRAKAFEKYIFGCEALYRIDVSSSSKKFGGRRDGGDAVQIIPPLTKNFRYQLSSYGLGLYIEDERSHRRFHSPANRFYEMLGAGLPMVFQPQAVAQLHKAGYDVRKFVAEDPEEVAAMLKRAEKIRRQQHALWHEKAAEDRGHLTAVLKELVKEL